MMIIYNIVLSANYEPQRFILSYSNSFCKIAIVINYNILYSL